MSIFTQVKNFWKYIEHRFNGRKEVMRLTADNKRKLFLKWKHGFENPVANEEIESTKRMLYFRDKDIPLNLISKNLKQWIKNEREFESYCTAIESQFGMKENKVVPIAQPDWHGSYD